MTAGRYCTEKCEKAPKCATCGRTKKPVGRDSMDNGLCQEDCDGYHQPPYAGHLWPGEIARSREVDNA
jgi:hypothetical protein